jgi:hypothetical protein
MVLELWLARFLKHPVTLDPDPGAGDYLTSYRLSPKLIEHGMSLAGEQKSSAFLRRLIRTARRGALEQRIAGQLGPAEVTTTSAGSKPRSSDSFRKASHLRASIDDELARLRAYMRDLGRSLRPDPQFRAKLEARIVELERQRKGNENSG